jgi:hypothetical protein
MEKLTNKKLIEKLLPIAMKYSFKYALGGIELNDVDYYGHNSYREQIDDNITVYFTNYDSEIFIEACYKLTGKYDEAAVTLVIDVKNKDIKGLGFRKTLRGLGNGYYADIDFTGNIIKSEYD